ncbi:MAG: DUF433 domain-containing protein [Saprospiraceae bacterium]
MINKYISIDPEIRFGKPCIKQTRISVEDILSWLASGMTYDEISDDYPQITKDHILAALSVCITNCTKTKRALNLRHLSIINH